MSFRKSDTIAGSFKPEQLYGRNTEVRVLPCAVEKTGETSGCTVAEYSVLDGIRLAFQDIHEEKMEYGAGQPVFSRDLIAVQHCREGRFEGEYPDGECIYMGPGRLSVNLPAVAPVTACFPLRHYYGFYIAVFQKEAEASIRRLETYLGPLGIDFDAIRAQLSEKNKLAFFQTDRRTDAFFASFYPSGEELREERLRLQVLELLQMLSAGSLKAPGPEQYYSRDLVRTVKRMRDDLTAHPEEHPSLPELAARYRISQTGMKNCFRAVYGSPIGAYLREYRMQAAAELLTGTEDRIVDIAAAVGYSNASKFSERFSSYYGILPGEYRKTFCPERGQTGGEE